MNEIQIFENEGLNLKVRTILQGNGDILISAEDAAKGFGFIKTEIKNGKQYVSIRWKRINDYLEGFNFRPQVGEGDFIPESIFYLLGMKAKNEIAKKFQLWLATDVIPSIRKTGSYTINKEIKLLSDENKILKEEITDLKTQIKTLTKATQRAIENFKPSHKTKLQYSKLIRQLTNTDEEYGFVKNWVLGCMNATKWEDLSVEDNNRIIELIFTTAKLLTIKKFEQLSMEV